MPLCTSTTIQFIACCRLCDGQKTLRGRHEEQGGLQRMVRSIFGSGEWQIVLHNIILLLFSLASALAESGFARRTPARIKQGL
jgi:hypothetical protein